MIEYKESEQCAVDRLLTMRKVEASYCLQSFLQQQCHQGKLTPLSATWRSKVVQWAFNVVDHFGISREVVSVAMSIFDRYLATQGNICSGNTVLLTSLTTLHIAIKLHETTRVKSSVLASLSRGQFDTRHIDDMEIKILAALSWKVHEPTTLAFIHEFVAFLPEEVTEAEKKEVYELSKYLTELTVCESTFVDRQNSVLALAAIRNVMETMNFSRVSLEQREAFLVLIAEIMGHSSESQTMQQTREKLKSMFAKVATIECFDAAYATQTQSQPFQGGRIVSPDGSPSSTATSYDLVHGSRRGTEPFAAGCHRRYREGTTKTHFWYTPSPPHSAKTAQVG